VIRRREQSPHGRLEERAAFERCEELRGYPAAEQVAALALWTEATEAVRDYRAKHTYVGRFSPMVTGGPPKSRG
jgi:hypothetical protein